MDIERYILISLAFSTVLTSLVLTTVLFRVKEIYRPFRTYELKPIDFLLNRVFSRFFFYEMGSGCDLRDFGYTEEEIKKAEKYMKWEVFWGSPWMKKIRLLLAVWTPSLIITGILVATVPLFQTVPNIIYLFAAVFAVVLGTVDILLLKKYENV